MCSLLVFVAISTADEPSVATTAAQGGAVGYIKKPGRCHCMQHLPGF